MKELDRLLKIQKVGSNKLDKRMDDSCRKTSNREIARKRKKQIGRACKDSV